jgi:hypothetical protein
VGVDADVGLRFRTAVGFVAHITGEYTRQSATEGSVAFAEDFFDLVVGAGWSL